MRSPERNCLRGRRGGAIGATGRRSRRGLQRPAPVGVGPVACCGPVPGQEEPAQDAEAHQHDRHHHAHDDPGAVRARSCAATEQHPGLGRHQRAKIRNRSRGARWSEPRLRGGASRRDSQRRHRLRGAPVERSRGRRRSRALDRLERGASREKWLWRRRQFRRFLERDLHLIVGLGRDARLLEVQPGRLLVADPTGHLVIGDPGAGRGGKARGVRNPLGVLWVRFRGATRTGRRPSVRSTIAATSVRLGVELGELMPMPAGCAGG